MRLTNVAQMDLVSGRLFSYAPEAAPGAGQPLPVSFDQGRHVGAGDRPGSWMALALRLPAPVERGELAAAWDAVVARHGTLTTAFSASADDAPALHEIALAPGVWQEHPAVGAELSRDVLRRVFDTSCRPHGRPSHRLCVVDPGPEAADARPELVIGSDHAHVDMWSLVILARDLLACLDDLRAERRPGAALPDAPAFAEHTAELEKMAPAPDAVRTRWASLIESGGGQLPVFPLPLGQLAPLPPEVVEVRDVLDGDATERLAAVARHHGVRLIAVGLSVLARVTAEQSGQPLRAVFPVHSRHHARWREAVGWFITNAVIETGDPDPAACAAAVQEAVGLGSWPLAPIFADYGGLPAPPGMFAVSWLDARRLPVPRTQAAELKYVSAAIHTDGVMIWFAVDESGLHLRCRYPDTPEARDSVGGWLDAVVAGLRGAAANGLPPAVVPAAD